MGFRYIDDIVQEDMKKKQQMEATMADLKMNNEIISAISKMTLRRFFVFFFFISKILQNKSMVGLPAYLKAGICRPQ